MHEVELMQSALDLALEAAARRRAKRIHRLTLRIGALSGVEPATLEFAFEVVVAGTIAEGGAAGNEVRRCSLLLPGM